MFGFDGGRRRVGLSTLIGAGALALLIPIGIPLGPAQAATRNLVANPSVEKRAGARPAGWLKVASGSNTRSFKYVTGAAPSGRRFVRTQISRRSTGYAGWTFAPVRVVGGASYNYSDHLRSNVRTGLRARIVTTSGKVNYRTFAPAARSRAWKSSGISFTLPRDAAKLSIERLLTSPGTLDLDNARLTLRALPRRTSAPQPKPAPAPATGPIVSVTLDDGAASQYTNGRSVLAANGIAGTFYLVSGFLDNPGFMTRAQARELKAAGHEIGSHTVNHANLAQLTPARRTQELAASKKALEAAFGPIRTFAYPYGSYNAAVQAETITYYQTARTTDGGLNARGSINRGQLKMRYVTKDTTAATVTSWMREAANAGAWTILVYHGIGPSGDEQTVTPAQFSAHMAAVKSSGLRTATVSAAYDAMT
jgi:hypothetical protein